MPHAQGQTNTASHHLFYLGLLLAVGFWVFEALIHTAFFKEEGFHWLPVEPDELWMRSCICLLFILFGFHSQRALNQRHQVESERETMREQLEQSLTRVLSGYVPICAHCKQIRDEHDQWIRVETYVQDRTEAEFTHSICPQCLHDHYPELD